MAKRSGPRPRRLVLRMSERERDLLWDAVYGRRAIQDWDSERHRELSALLNRLQHVRSEPREVSQ